MLRLATLISCAVLAFLLSGCVVTTDNPIYTSEDKNYQEELVGTWQIPGAGFITFKRIGDSNDYWVTSSDVKREKFQYFLGVIADIGTSPYLDLLMLDSKEEALMAKAAPGPVRDLVKGTGEHIFVKLFIFDDNVSYATVDPEWMQKFLTKSPGALEHKAYPKDADGKELSGAKTEITARTGEVRKFISDHNTEGLLSPAVRLIRVAAADQLGGPDIGDIDK